MGSFEKYCAPWLGNPHPTSLPSGLNAALKFADVAIRRAWLAAAGGRHSPLL